MMRWLKKWFGGWTDTATNAWGIASEQRRGSEYRHRTIDPMGDHGPWQPGPHPIAQRLRDEGKTETDGFRKEIKK